MYQIKNENYTNICQVMEAREGIDQILHPNTMPYLDNLEESVSYLVKNKENTITIVGDYDVDGIMATGIMKRGLALCGLNANTRIPRRFSEGYGISEKIIDEIPEGLILTVDNGIAAHDVIGQAKERGLHVIVTDHHLPPKDKDEKVILPPADAVFDPWVNDKSEYQNYCGAGLAYRFILELIKQMKVKPYPEKELNELKTIAAIATVADVMPLVGANHALVKEGLDLLRHNVTVPGIRVLCVKMDIDMTHITEDDFGFKIGPAINAPGRLYDDGASQALDIILAPPEDYTLVIKVNKMIQDNDMRKDMVRAAISKLSNIKQLPIVVFDPSWGEGIIGLIAGQLCECYYCPVIAFTRMHNGHLKGSGRSIPEIHLKNVLDSMQDIICKYGGHAEAAGLEIEEKDLQTFRQRFHDACGLIPKKEVVKYDVSITGKVNLNSLLRELNSYAPYGNGNEKPVFRLPYNAKDVRQSKDGASLIIKGKMLDLLGFGQWEKYNSLGRPLELEVIGHLSENWFRGKSQPTLEIIDLCQRQKRN